MYVCCPRLSPGCQTEQAYIEGRIGAANGRVTTSSGLIRLQVLARLQVYIIYKGMYTQ